MKSLSFQFGESVTWGLVLRFLDGVKNIYYAG